MFISRGEGSTSVVNIGLVRKFFIKSKYIGGDMPYEYFICFIFDKEHNESWRYETRREAEEVYRKILAGTYGTTNNLIKL